MPRTLIDIVEIEGTERPTKVAFQFLSEGNEAQRLTYGALWREMNRIAAALRRSGVRPGDRVILLYPPGLRFPTAFMGTMLAGACAVPLYPPRPSKDGCAPLQRVVRDCAARAVLAWPALAADLPELGVQVLSDSGFADDEFECHPRSALAYLQYTSGSTGTPKGVMVTHANLMDNIAYISRAFEVGEESVGIHWLPPYHDMGLVGGILTTIHGRCSSVLMAPSYFIQKPIRWLQAIGDYRGTVSGGPNFAFELCTAKTDPESRGTLDLSSWEVAFNGAERVRGASLRRFAEAFAPSGFRPEAFLSCYGLAEATLMVAGGRGMRVTDDGQVGCGQMSETNGDVRIVNIEGDPSSGEIVVAGPSVAAGYWGDEAHTAETFGMILDGKPFLRTGDIGLIRDGELFIRGRIKEMLIVRGRNYFPQDIEATVETSHPALAPNSCAAFSIDGDEEQLVILQEVRRDHVRSPDTAATLEAIRGAVVRTFEISPSVIMLLRPAKLPRTPNGKLQRVASRAAFLAGTIEALGTWRAEAKPPPPVLDLPAVAADHGEIRSAIRAWLTACLAHEIGVDPADIDASARLEELGMDSLQQVTVLSNLSLTFGLAESPELFEGYPTLEALADYLSILVDVQTRISDLPLERRRAALLAVANGSATRRAGGSEAIPDEDYRAEFFPEVRALAERRGWFEASGLPNPYFTVTSATDGPRAIVDGAELLNYSSNDYLGLARHPDVVAAARDAVESLGTSVSASRIVAGERPLHGRLEAALADMVGVDDALVFVGGNAANVSTIGHLFGPGDFILYDERSHDSVLKGIALSHADSCAFRHNNVGDAERILQEKRSHYRRVLLFVEGIYSMDGDIPDLPRFVELKERHRALLMVDECLSIGVLGATGRGIGEHFDFDPKRVDIWMGGLSKALASCGGYIAGSSALIDYLRYTASGFIFTTGISPANTAAALAAIETLRREPWRLQRLRENGDLFRNGAKELGFDTGTSAGTPAVPVFARDQGECLRLYGHMRHNGIHVQPIFAPAVPPDESRLRFFLTCMHSPSDIAHTLGILAAAGGR